MRPTADGDRLRAGRQREHRRVRSARRDRRRRRRHGAWLHVDGAFGLWAGGERGAASSRPRHRARRFVGDRRAQMAQRAIRLRARLRRASGGAPRGDEPGRGVSRAIAGGAARADGLGAGVVAPRARLRRLRRAAFARPQRRRRSRRSLLPAGAAVRGSPARGAGDSDPQRRRAQSGAGARRAGRGGDADAATRDALRLVQEERICWLGGSRWHDMDAMRISVSNWSTTRRGRRSLGRLDHPRRAASR